MWDDPISDLLEHSESVRALNDPRLTELYRIAKFARAIAASSEVQDTAERLRYAEPTPEALVALREFVAHIVDQEFYMPLLTDADGKVDRNQWRALQWLTLTSALDEHISRMQRGSHNRSTTLQIIPCRGLGLELSGHTGDTCWAAETKDGSFAQKYPNVTGLLFVRNPGEASERLVGSALLVITTDLDTGEEVVIIRGINPIENYINATNANDFLSSLFDYAKSVSHNRRVAVVINPQGPGGAATNRPAIYAALNINIRGRLTESRPMRPAANSTVNGYSLSPGEQNTYYLRAGA